MLAPAQRFRFGVGAAVALAFAAACAEAPTDVPIPNRPPVVAISAGPIRDSVDVFLKLETEFEGADCTNGCFRNSGVTITLQRLNGFEGAYPSPAASSEGFPDLRVARSPYAGNPIKGVPSCEGMVTGYGLDVNPRLRLFGGRLDTLYYYQSNGRLEAVPPLNSYMDGAACALRYSGPGQGKLMVFGFPIYFLGDDQVSFDIEPEITIKLAKRGVPIREVAIRYSGRTRAEGKKIGLADGVAAVWTLVKFRFVD